MTNETAQSHRHNEVEFGSQDSDKVFEIQKMLQSHGMRLKADGVYKSITKSVVGEFQRRNKLLVNGVVDNETWQKLKAE